MSRPRILLLFLDGVGIGPADPDVNPFFRADLPTLTEAFGGRLPSLDDPAPDGPFGRAFPVDATLGVSGLPQSGTGQIALLTGVNAPERFGGHFGPWPPMRLRPLLEESNLLVEVVRRGMGAAFANAYPAGWPGDLPTRRHAAPPLAALAAGVLDRDLESLARGEAVASEIVNAGWRKYTGRTDLPDPTPEEAGRTLVRIAGEAELTFFAHYRTDDAGHRGGMEGGVRALQRVDRFVAGIMDGIRERAAGDDDDELIVVGCSDHGNIEDVRGGHTRNPALGFVLRAPGGPGVDSADASAPGASADEASTPDPMRAVDALTGITPAILEALAKES